MTVRWTVRAATDRGPQAESRVLFEAPKHDNPNLFFYQNRFGLLLYF